VMVLNVIKTMGFNAIKVMDIGVQQAIKLT
jgi:hypothetical protein